MIKDCRYFQHLRDGEIPINDGEDRVYYFEMHQYYSHNAFRNFSIKFPLDGIVTYQAGGKEFDLLPKNILVCSKQPGKVFVDSDSIVQAFCIDISHETFAEVFTLLSSNKINDLDNFRPGHFFCPDFFENIYPEKSSELGVWLSSLVSSICNENTGNLIIRKEIFYTLAEKIILHESANIKSLNRLSSIKPSTKRETLKRLLHGKSFMDENYLQNPKISEISQFANISEFHFFRNFKEAFGISPYQYMLGKRLDHSKQLIGTNQPLSKIATSCCFPDLFTFSKAFKKKYGYPPSVFKKKPTSEKC